MPILQMRKSSFRVGKKLSNSEEFSQLVGDEVRIGLCHKSLIIHHIFHKPSPVNEKGSSDCSKCGDYNPFFII